jgi:alpha 1,4-glycosyltransferase
LAATIRSSDGLGISVTDGASGEGQVFRSFWHGRPLNSYQLLCLRSFVARGHRVELFTYQGDLAVPPWIARRDAREILPANRVLHYQVGLERGSPSLHSNLFRYVLLHRLGGWWVDIDVALLSAELPPDPLFFAPEQVGTTADHPDARTRFGTAVMKFPSQHPLLSDAIARCLAVGETARWGQTGPHLFTELIDQHRLAPHAKPKTSAYPIPWWDTANLFDPDRCDEARRNCKDSTFVHLWHSKWRDIPMSAAPPLGSFLDWLVGRVDFDLDFQGRMELVPLSDGATPARPVSPASAEPRPASPSRRLLFAFAPPGDAWPSALLRGHQMIEIASGARSDIECRAVGLEELLRLRGEWVVLTKSALLVSTRDTISHLHALGHHVIADFVDQRVDDDVAASVDVLLASSASQERYFRFRFSHIPTFHVTHHVDLRLPAIAAPTDRARVGYFGKFANCLHVNGIADLVSIVDANDASDPRWMSRLSECNAHYAIRGAEDPGVFKPFLKGFTAAHCGAPIIVADDDAEAQAYLGGEYPFVVGDLSLASVREHIKRFAGAYATSTWKSATEAMKGVANRSSRRHVEQELRALLNAIW